MNQQVLLLGATGQTGHSILNGLLEYGGYQVSSLVRPSSAESPKVKAVAERNVKIIVADTNGSIEELTRVLRGYDIVISAIDAVSMHQQIGLATAAKKAGVKRFVPCAFITVCPPGDVMVMRDEKEVVYQHIRKLSLPYTVIDVGVWHQVAFPTLPSGRVDYASFYRPSTAIHAGGDAPMLLTDLRDIGHFVARIVNDERTLNQYVYTWSDVLTYSTAEEIEASIERVKSAIKADPSNTPLRLTLVPLQYSFSKTVRRENQPKYAKYLGYLDARELYPDFEPRSFKSFLEELLQGKAEAVYQDNHLLEQMMRGIKDMGLSL
ncbi:hypothetical protein BDV29DRAFT_189966 [Aspergillus leporis]|uniref:NmrA-like domain-containing protein n=1 Tax=Aspergillus leporis TaxID=41062 RepID=A0A5N5X8Q7_9EURO|nr:hypothetical protein BDV29DRAFT_189966 [Aspergillus leporis]